MPIPKRSSSRLNEWAEVFQKLPRIDAVFVPGGDPGHTQPKYLMALLEKQTASLHKYHPKAQMWVSPQSFDQVWMDEFLEIVRKEPSWLAGIVHGPQVRMSLKQLRAATPKKYPIRNYPDITHSLRCQFPVPDWDAAFAVTQGREGINPRPLGMATIFRAYQKYTSGFITYSEGCNDDVNKMVWSGLGWDPDADVLTLLRDYSRYFLGPRYTESFAQGLLALERNWQGPVLTNSGTGTTLLQFQTLEKGATPQVKLNWRFQQALYRAYYDAYVRSRLLYETQLEEQALGKLREAKMLGTGLALQEAEAILDAAVTKRTATDYRARVFEMAEALFQSIRMQLSVDRYKAISVGRGANLDTIDQPLNNRRWLKDQFEEIRKLATEVERLQRIDEIIHWKDPGPGGFYDDLGNAAAQPHLVKGRGIRARSRLLAKCSRSISRIGRRAGEEWWDQALARRCLTPRWRCATRDWTGRPATRSKSFMARGPIRLVANEQKWRFHPPLTKTYPGRGVRRAGGNDGRRGNGAGRGTVPPAAVGPGAAVKLPRSVVDAEAGNSRLCTRP